MISNENNLYNLNANSWYFAVPLEKVSHVYFSLLFLHFVFGLWESLLSLSLWFLLLFMCLPFGLWMSVWRIQPVVRFLSGSPWCLHTPLSHQASNAHTSPEKRPFIFILCMYYTLVIITKWTLTEWDEDHNHELYNRWIISKFVLLLLHNKWILSRHHLTFEIHLKM